MITQDLGIATAYGYAKSKGYTGTEAEFAELMASYASTAQTAIEAADKAVEANTAAQSAKTDAAASKTAAQTAAQTATSKASEASQSASTATTKASEASRSASTASTAATSAGTSAQTATTAAATATTKASEASESATTASAAKTDAETARDAAAQSASEAAASAESIDPDEFDRKIYAAFVTDTASGSIAHFEDGADSIPMKDALVHIEPVQEGSGDPSPDNVRPITGWTSAKVTRTGKNFMRLPTIEEIYTSPLVVDYRSIPLQLEPNTTYYLFTTFLNGYTPIDKGIYALVTPSADSNTPWAAFAHSGQGKKDGTLTTGDSGMLYLRFFGHNRQRIDELYANAQIQLEKGSTATDYEPYSGQTYDITFPTEAGTVYGGTLDVTKGELVVDRAIIASYAGETLPSIWISDRDVYSAGVTPTTGAQVVYKLATPTTYQLTPQEITSLLGTNNVWADTGDSDVEYRADAKMYITKKITEAVSALS